MNWNEARTILLSRKGYTKVAKATGLHPNGIRKYALGLTIPRQDNAEKIIEYIKSHVDRRVADRRSG